VLVDGSADNLLACLSCRLSELLRVEHRVDLLRVGRSELISSGERDLLLVVAVQGQMLVMHLHGVSVRHLLCRLAQGLKLLTRTLHPAMLLVMAVVLSPLTRTVR